MLKIVFLLVDSFKLLHLLKTIKLWVKIKVKLNLNTLENSDLDEVTVIAYGERNKKEVKVPSKLKLGNIGIDSIIKTK